MMDPSKVIGSLDVPSIVAIACFVLVLIMVFASFVFPAPKPPRSAQRPPGPAQPTPPQGAIGGAILDHIETGRKIAAAKEIERRLAQHHAADFVDDLFAKLTPSPPKQEAPPTPPPPKE